MISGIPWEDAIDAFRGERPHTPWKQTSKIVNAPIPHLFNPLARQRNIRAAPKLLPPTFVRCSQASIPELRCTPHRLYRLLAWPAQGLVSDSNEDVVLTGQ